MSPAITEQGYRGGYSQRRGHSGVYALQQLINMIEESAIGDYTIEQVISKADPCDYR